MMPVLAMMFVAQQAIYFSGSRARRGKLRLVNYVAISGWLVLSTVLLFVLVTGGTLVPQRGASAR